MANALETKLSNAKDVARKFLVEEITEQRPAQTRSFENNYGKSGKFLSYFFLGYSLTHLGTNL